MILSAVDYSEIPEIYGVFPMKKDFLEAGNAALQELGIQAVAEGNEIRIPFLSRLYYDEEELAQICDENEECYEDLRKCRLKATALLRLGDEPGKNVVGAFLDWELTDFYDVDEEDFDDNLTPEEEAAGQKAIEKFLDAAVDTGE